MSIKAKINAVVKDKETAHKNFEKLKETFPSECCEAYLPGGCVSVFFEDYELYLNFSCGSHKGSCVGKGSYDISAVLVFRDGKRRKTIFIHLIFDPEASEMSYQLRASKSMIEAHPNKIFKMSYELLKIGSDMNA